MLRPSQHRFLAWMMLAVLAAGLLGAITDHHYADRQPWHDHIYSADGLSEHTHHYSIGHQHADHRHGPAPSDIVTISANFASAGYWALLSLGIAVLGYLIAVGPPPFELVRRVGKWGLPNSIFLRQPLRPPVSPLLST